jgi:cold shock CspA family protein
MRYGTIVRWDPRKKFGFIQPDRGPDIFFHISALGACTEPRIEIGQPVKYEVDPKTLPKRQRRSEIDEEKPAAEPVSPRAMMVELIDKMPGAILDGVAEEARVAHHPKARRKKPTWRR